MDLETDNGSFYTVLVDAADPRVLRVRFPIDEVAPSEQDGPCAPLTHPFAYVAAQDATLVKVAVAGYRRTGSVPATGEFSCAGTITRYSLLAVELAMPLGTRKVFRSLGGEPLEVISEQSVRIPRYLPLGYVASPATVFVATSDHATRRYRHGHYRLDISTGRPRDLVMGHPTASVDGHPAVVDGSGDFRSVSWAVSRELAYQVTSHLDSETQSRSASPPGTGAELSVTELLRVARSLF